MIKNFGYFSDGFHVKYLNTVTDHSHQLVLLIECLHPFFSTSIFLNVCQMILFPNTRIRLKDETIFMS